MQDNTIANEIEVKILEVNKEELISKIEKAGGKLLGKRNILSRFFTLPNGKYVRLRKNENNGKTQNVLAYKEVLDENGMMKNFELESEFSDFDNLCEIFTRLGFENPMNPEKIRTTYELNGTKIEFDDIKGIPCYLEIEAGNEEKLKEMVTFLGYTMQDTKALREPEVRALYNVAN